MGCINAKEKWNAVLNNDSEYDGLFYYGVKTTGIFCRPSCRSRNPKQDNVLFFDNIEQAYACGLRPCKRCRPDLVSFNPTNPMKQSIEKAKQIMDNHYMNKELLSSKIKSLCISQNYFTNLFSNQFGVTPSEYLSSIRIRKAEELLSMTSIDIVNVAMECGFDSLSSFYKSFRKQLGTTPKQYRKNMMLKEG